MSPEPVVMSSYNAKNFQALMAEYKGLRTFADVAAWDQRASAEVEVMVSAIRELDGKSAAASRKFEQAKKERAQKDFISRLFAGKALEQSYAQLMQNYGAYKIGLEGWASQLQEAIDFTPNSLEEQKSLLKELKARKKELQVEKREATAAMKAIRTDARKQSANAGTTGIFYNPKSASYERRHIRYQKEAALHPHEDTKAAVERQLIQVDRDILWAEKFT